MGITIEVSIEALRRSEVHGALVALMSHLGGHGHGHGDGARAGRAPTPIRVPVVLGGLSHSAPAGRARRRGQRARPDLGHLPPNERWRRYVEGLPDASRHFVTLLEERGRLTVEQAVSALGLETPKAMGGLTGAMARWAPRQGVELPFEAGKDANGARCWTWLGAAHGE